MPLERGVFVLSFDVELAWGEIHRTASGRVGVERLLAARANLEPLLGLLDRHAIPATFAVVGHLMLDRCPGHARDPRPTFSFGPPDWYGAHPRGGEREAPAWYGASLVELIRKQPRGHELAALGHTHAPLGMPGASAALAQCEFQAAAAALSTLGVTPRSFVFPLNRVACLDRLEQAGFRCFRAPQQSWYRSAPAGLRKLGHGLEQLGAVSPPTGHARRVGGLWEIPDSMLFLSREGWRGFVPMRSRRRRALEGIERAVRRREVFHLWMHLEDLVPDTQAMFAGLDGVFAEVRRRTLAGELEPLTMGGLAERMEACAFSASAS
jgi:peptidoglycan/xylan/chitin deacetylase (PgdA/CDA1 family)